jgi:Tfp pilus assembly protein PilF
MRRISAFRICVCLVTVTVAAGCAASGPLRTVAPRRAEPPATRVLTVEASYPALARALVALAGQPSAAGHRAVAAHYARLGITDVAHEHLTAAVSIDPGDAEAWVGLARIWRDWGFPHLALPDAYRALHFARDSAEVHETLGSILQALGRHDAARAAYQRGLALEVAAARREATR